MSRIGTKPLKLAKGVTLASDASGVVTVKGPKGSVKFAALPSVRIVVEGEIVRVERTGETKHDRSCHGLVRSVLENHIQGVQTPFTRVLDIQGVGYQCAKKGKQLALKVGFSNEVFLEPPEGVTFELPSATRIVVSGCDVQQVGQFAAKVRSVRPPEPYNGKGIKYENERIQRKAGKAFASAGATGA
jgi:large subunit ribosomal protein L6